MAQNDNTFTVKIVTDETFRAHQGFDLTACDDLLTPASELPKFSVEKQEKVADFKKLLAAKFGCQPKQIRLWALVTRSNQTVRANWAVPDDDPELTMEGVRDCMASKPPVLKLYLQVLDLQQLPANVNYKKPPLTIFVKHFDVTSQTLVGLGCFRVHPNQPVHDLVPFINRRMNFAKGTTLQLFEEIKPGHVVAVKSKTTFLQNKMQNGDIICFQISLSQKVLLEEKNSVPFKDADRFYNSLLNQVLVHFKPRHNHMAAAEEFHLVFPIKLTYDAMAKQVAKRLGCEFLNLRFTKSHQGNPETVIRRGEGAAVVGEMIQPSDTIKSSNVLFYELLNMSIVEIELKRNIKVTWKGAQEQDQVQYSFQMPETSSMNDVADKLAGIMRFSNGSTGKIKLFKIHEGRIKEDIAGIELLGNVPDLENIYAEEYTGSETEEWGSGGQLTDFSDNELSDSPDCAPASVPAPELEPVAAPASTPQPNGSSVGPAERASEALSSHLHAAEKARELASLPNSPAPALTLQLNSVATVQAELKAEAVFNLSRIPQPIAELDKASQAQINSIDLKQPPPNFDVSLVRRPLDADDLAALQGAEPVPSSEVIAMVPFKCAENALAHCLKTVSELLESLPTPEPAEFDRRRATLRAINTIALKLREECVPRA